MTNLKLLERKGVFYYKYLDTLVRLNEPALPQKEALFIKLGFVECSLADYAHAKSVWDNCHCQSLKE